MLGILNSWNSLEKISYLSQYSFLVDVIRWMLFFLWTYETRWRFYHLFRCQVFLFTFEPDIIDFCLEKIEKIYV